MDPRARLDHAVFHLTPTRTRCDLVAFCGKSSEKLASGLLEPFVSHLKVARDEIQKGGYSITLRPPSHLDSRWFTKATFQRFVRFVSTPEILERFVSIEKEIQQIESSIQSNESASDQVKAGVDAAGEGENSKARLQHVLGSRRAILRREQAMAYQRALVLGFDIGSVDDLLAFAGCFGAKRLKEACFNFRELCMMKHNDSLWMDELAAVKAIAPPEHPFVETAAIVLTSEIEPNTTDNKDQIPSVNGHGSMPWRGHYPPYMYNSMQQGHHPFPMMQYPPYYPPNMQWSPNMDQSGGHHHSRKSKKKGRSSDGKTSEEDSQSESSNSASASASDSDLDEYKQNRRNHSPGERGRKKKHKKKPSKTVVIRNINYITSKPGEEDAVYDSDYELQGAEKLGRKNGKLGKEASVDENGLVKSASDGNQTSGTWDNFQNLLMMNKDSDTDVTTKQNYSPYEDNSKMDMGGEKSRVQHRSLPPDSFMSSNGFIDGGRGMTLEELESNKSFRPAMRRGDIGGEDLIFSHGHDGQNNFSSNLSTESAMNKIVKGEDWSIANQSGLLKNVNGITEHKSFDGSYELSPLGNQYSAGSRKDSFVDDSIVVQSHSTMNSQEDSQWKTDLSVVFDQTVTKTETEPKESSEDRLARHLSYEPDDMFFMPERDSGQESSQMDFGAEISFSLDQKRNSSVYNSAEVKSNGDNKVSENGDKKSGKEAKPKAVPRYLSKSKPPEVRNKKPFSSKPAVQKSKQEKEDEIRRKMEELVIERQKRIAERSATKSLSTTTAKKTTPKVSTKSR